MSLNNRAIYLTDPTTRKLVNEGVANVNDENTAEALSVLRYELETFVCDGQYEKGLEHILATYLRNTDQAQQPAAWVSGFFGSGKSHLVKMLRAFWVDTEFPDGARARGVAHLPAAITDHLRELTNQGRRHGGLHAASGTLGAAASGSVRLALLRIVFKSAGLPEQYPLARFSMWLRSEGIYDAVRADVEQHGYDWNEELDDFYVAEGLHEALVRTKPNLFSSVGTCVQTLNNLYPFVQDVSNDEMLKALRQALTRDGKFPLTLIVLDEVQQYIGPDSQRSMDVQEAVEACCKHVGGKLLFIATGQTAVTGTSNLKKLEGRFTVRVELSDTDVEAVLRQVILAKKPEMVGPVQQVMNANVGEVSRHLAGSQIGHREADSDHFAQDYPILPVRRRFWDLSLRILDQTGTQSQLRNQLSMIHKVIQTNLDQPLGHVIPADALYFDSADKLLQARVLPRKVYEKIVLWSGGTADERLMARACGLVFLINKVAGSQPEAGVRATVDTLADLLIENLADGSTALRSKLPALLDGCELLIKVGEEHRIQTEESAAWTDEFLSQRNQLGNEAYRVDAERDDRIRQRLSELLKKLYLVHGNAKIPRDIHPVFGSQLPPDSGKKICLWIRDGWAMDENSVRADARQASNTSPTIFVFIPKRSADDLRNSLIDFKAASATLDKRGVPTSPEGIEARAAMETLRQTAEGRIRELLNDAFSGARVFQGGGNEIVGNDLQAMIMEAAQHALHRLYPHFPISDHAGWAKAYELAQKGAPDALKAVGDGGEAANNPVCKGVLASIGNGKTGTEIRAEFEQSPYGWSGDAVDGALRVLLVAGLLRARGESGQVIDPRALERKAIGKTRFEAESTTITTAQRIQIRKVLQKAGVMAAQGEELAAVPAWLQKMQDLADAAGGESPKPERPNTAHLDEIRLTAGNAQLLSVYNQRDELLAAWDQWQAQAEGIARRWPAWIQLQRLMSLANGIDGADVLRAQVDPIAHQRLLLAEPDPVTPLLAAITQALRDALNQLVHRYNERHAKGMARLEVDSNWQQLEPEQRHELLVGQRLTLADAPTVKLGTTAEILQTLEIVSLHAFSDRVAALPSRFDAVLAEAAELLEPQVQFVAIPRPTLRSVDEIDAWAEDVKQKLKAALDLGPVVIR